MKKILLFGVPVIGLVSLCIAADMPSHEEMRAAMDSCVSTASKDSQGRPVMSEVDACLSAKGFEKPSGKPPHERGERGAPPQE